MLVQAILSLWRFSEVKTEFEQVDIIDQQCQIGSSIGISIYPEHARYLDELIKNADTIMYDVKNSGKNNYKLYEPDKE